MGGITSFVTENEIHKTCFAYNFEVPKDAVYLLWDLYD